MFQNLDYHRPTQLSINYFFRKYKIMSSDSSKHRAETPDKEIEDSTNQTTASTSREGDADITALPGPAAGDNRQNTISTRTVPTKPNQILRTPKKHSPTSTPRKRQPTKKQLVTKHRAIEYLDTSESESDNVDSNTFSLITFFKLLMLTFDTPAQCLEILFNNFRLEPTTNLPTLTKIITKLSSLEIDNIPTISWKNFLQSLKKTKFCTILLSPTVTNILTTFANHLHEKALGKTMESSYTMDITETDGGMSTSSTTVPTLTPPVVVPSSTVSPLEEDTIKISGTAEKSLTPIGEISCSIFSRNKKGRLISKWEPKTYKPYLLKTSIYPIQTIKKVSKRDWWKYSVKDIMTYVNMDPHSPNNTPTDIAAMNLLHNHSQDRQQAITENRITEDREEPTMFLE
nr:ORF2 [Afoambidensovirus incertum 1]